MLVKVGNEFVKERAQIFSGTLSVHDRIAVGQQVDRNAVGNFTRKIGFIAVILQAVDFAVCILRNLKRRFRRLRSAKDVAAVIVGVHRVNDRADLLLKLRSVCLKFGIGQSPRVVDGNDNVADVVH